MSVENNISGNKIFSDSQRSTSTSGNDTVNNSNSDIVYIHEAGVTATLTINFPTAPINNQIVTISSVSGITALTLATGAGSIIGTITTLAVLGSARYMWLQAQNKWYKI